MSRHLPHVGRILLLLAGCGAVWTLGGMLIGWLGLDDLDLIGRILLIFGFLTACQAAQERLQVSAVNAHHQQE